MDGSTNHRQSLNPIDRVMLCADTAVRTLGYPGIETQMLVWLQGRIDTISLHAAITRLSQRHPIVAARLAAAEHGHNDSAIAHWIIQPEATCPIDEAVLPSDDPQAVLEHAAKLLSEAGDPTQVAPLRFHLMHRPGGRDVLLLQYSHVLMDNRTAIVLLQEIRALATAESDPPRAMHPGNRILEQLRHASREERHAALDRAIELQTHTLRGRATALRSAGPRPGGSPNLQILARVIPEQQVRAVRSRIVAICGYPGLSMALLGSVFRAIRLLAPNSDHKDRQFIAGIGIDLDSHKRTSLIFQNRTSLVPIRAHERELDDRDELVRTLSAQMRQRLDDQIDLGMLCLSAIYSRRPRHVDWAVHHMLRYAYSLWYAYFGPLDAAGRELCGATIETISYAGPVWGSTGLTLLTNQYRGQLILQATYDPRVVPPSLATEFLNAVRADLPGSTSRTS